MRKSWMWLAVNLCIVAAWLLCALPNAARDFVGIGLLWFIPALVAVNAAACLFIRKSTRTWAVAELNALFLAFAYAAVQYDWFTRLVANQKHQLWTGVEQYYPLYMAFLMILPFIPALVAVNTAAYRLRKAERAAWWWGMGNTTLGGALLAYIGVCWLQNLFYESPFPQYWIAVCVAFAVSVAALNVAYLTRKKR